VKFKVIIVITLLLFRRLFLLKTKSKNLVNFQFIYIFLFNLMVITQHNKIMYQS